MSKYNVGDVVKLRDDLEENKDYGYINAGMINQIKSEPFWIAEVQHDKYINSMGWVANDEMIEGLWEECKEKQDKLKLIDVLNMIAKGELKEGTKVKYKNIEWEYKTFGKEGEKDLVDKANFTLFEQFYMDALSDEVELIEPSCEHEWLNWETRGIGEGIIRRFRRCVKCGLEEVTEKCVPDVGNTIEPTKIEELEISDRYYTVQEIIGKLNEVIRKINKKDK